MITLFGVSGCNNEVRGPTLAGGREVKSWVADLHDPRPQVRRQAVLKLGNVADADPTVAESLAEASVILMRSCAAMPCMRSRN